MEGGGGLQLPVKLHLLPLHACLSATSCISKNRCTAVRKKEFGKQGEASLIKHQTPRRSENTSRGALGVVVGWGGVGGLSIFAGLSLSEWLWSRRLTRSFHATHSFFMPAQSAI